MTEQSKLKGYIQFMDLTKITEEINEIRKNIHTTEDYENALDWMQHTIEQLIRSYDCYEDALKTEIGTEKYEALKEQVLKERLKAVTFVPRFKVIPGRK